MYYTPFREASPSLSNAGNNTASHPAPRNKLQSAPPKITPVIPSRLATVPVQKRTWTAAQPGDARTEQVGVRVHPATLTRYMERFGNRLGGFGTGGGALGQVGGDKALCHRWGVCERVVGYSPKIDANDPNLTG